MASELTSPQLETLRKNGNWGRLFLAIPQYTTVYAAELDVLPESNDMVVEIEFTSGVGTLSDVRPDMTMYVGTAPGLWDLGICRVRKSPIAGTFYIAETSRVVWEAGAHLTIVNSFNLWQRSLKLATGVPLMDWDIAYDDQHHNYDPVPSMGTHHVVKLVGSSVNVTLGPKSDTPAWVIDSTIESVLWEVPGAVAIDDDAATNPVVTFDAEGTYACYCTFTAENGKTFWGVRYVIVHSESSPLIDNFKLDGFKFSKGSGGFDVKILGGKTIEEIPPMSLVILCAETFNEDGAVQLPSLIENDNVLAVGWADSIDMSTDSDQRVSLDISVRNAQAWLAKIVDYPSGLRLCVGESTAWTDMEALDVRKALWHFLHWRSTATRVMDIQIESDARYAGRFQTAKGNLWARLVQVATPTIFQVPAVDQFSRLFIQIDPNMVPVADRTWPTVIDLEVDDIGDISWSERGSERISMLSMSGIRVNVDGGASSFFSLSPGKSYERIGDEDSIENLLVAGQENCNALCGLYYGNRNSEFENIQLTFTRPLLAFSVAERNFISVTVPADKDPRGVGFTANLIPREMSLSVEEDSMAFVVTVACEFETFPGPSITDYIPTMEDVDFSLPDFPSMPGLPVLLPLPTFPLPSDVIPTSPPKVVLVGSRSTTPADAGVYYTETFDEASPLWHKMYGIDDDTAQYLIKVVKTPSGVVYALTGGDPDGDKVFRANSVGGEFFTFATIDTLGVDTIHGIGLNELEDDTICLIVGTEDGSGELNYLYPVTNGVITVGVTGLGARRGIESAPVFFGGLWYVFHSSRTPFSTPTLSIMTPDGTLVEDYDINTALGQDATMRFGIATGSDIFQWDGSGAGGYNKVSFDGVPTRTTSPTPQQANQGAAFDPIGQYGMMASTDVGGKNYVSEDGGVTWTEVTATMPGLFRCVANCLDSYRFIFGGTGSLKYTQDRGLTNVDKLGNLLLIAPDIDIHCVRMVSNG